MYLSVNNWNTMNTSEYPQFENASKYAKLPIKTEQVALKKVLFWYTGIVGNPKLTTPQSAYQREQFI